MTSLGLLQYSEINDNSAINSNITDTEKKKQAKHNITVKKRHDTNNGGSDFTTNPTPNSENVQNMLKLINNSNGYENEDDNNGLVDFNPPPRAEVSTKSGPQQNDMGPNANAMPNAMPNANLNIDYEKPTTFLQQPQQAQAQAQPDNNTMAVKPRQYPVPLDSYEGFNAMPKTYATDYYKQYVPYFNQGATASGSATTSGGGHMNKNQLLEKLNYMIHLLEEQKDEKTGHVMEEVILYSFLGVFIIFIVDSFARVGKYTR